jgi:bla regulator protein BlaR1
METAGLELLTTTPLIRTLCWILIHSLWIGAGISLIALIGLTVTQKSSSRLRYNMLLTCLILFLLATGLAGFLEFQSHRLLAATSNQFQDALHFSHLTHGSSVPKINTIVLQFIDSYSGWIVLLWAILLCYRMFELCRGFGYVYQLRYQAIPLLEAQWTEKLQKLASKLGVSEKIAILQSAHVKVPVTIGHFKPVIIVPLGFFLQLPFAQVEAVLFHELAHIYRRDYLVNLLQNMVDAIFFFNPGLRWLSAMIREQREICCDDLVVANTLHKSDYLRGLIAFTPSTPPALRLVTLSLHGSLLAQRLQRLIDGKNQQFIPISKVIAFLGLLALPFLGDLLQVTPKKAVVKSEVILPKPQQIKADTKPPKAIGKVITKRQKLASPLPKEQIPEPTAPLPDTTFKLASIKFERSNEDMANRIMNIRDGDGNTYHVIISKNELVGLKINDAMIPESELPKYLPLLAKIDQAWNEARAIKKRNVELLFANNSVTPK